jgi:hypothetical protein
MKCQNATSSKSRNVSQLSYTVILGFERVKMVRQGSRASSIGKSHSECISRDHTLHRMYFSLNVGTGFSCKTLELKNLRPQIFSPIYTVLPLLDMFSSTRTFRKQPSLIIIQSITYGDTQRALLHSYNLDDVYYAEN